MTAPISLPVPDVVPASAHAVIELFATELAKVAFPDLDVAALRRHADELRAQAAAVARAREALAAAEAQLATRGAALGEACTRGLAYARIYAAAHPERSSLAGALTALDEASPVSATSPPAKRRGRPPKARPAPQPAELFASNDGIAS